MCIHLFLPKIHVFSTRPTFHFQKHQLPTTYGMVHWRRATGDGRRRSTAHHATPCRDTTAPVEQNKLWMGSLVVGRLSGRAQHPLHSADCREPLSRQLPTSSGSAAGWLPSTFIVCDASEKVPPGKCELCVLMAKNGKWYAYFTVRAKYPYLKVFTRNPFFCEFCPTYIRHN